MRLRFLLPIILSAAGACTTVQTTMPGAIGVERKQSFLVSSQDVEAAASESYQQLVMAGRQKGSLNANRAQHDRVKAIADRLIGQTAVFRADAARWSWDVSVLTSESVNAACMAGGKIIVFTGLLEKLDLTDAELAAVLGHEIAHALREHSREKVSNAYAQRFVLAGIGLATGLGQVSLQLVNAVSEVTFSLPNSRQMGTEADYIGLELMARAGFDPTAAVTFFEKLAREGGSSGPAFLSTHPQNEARAADLRANIARVMPLYVAALNRVSSIRN
jgi:predicted Zn-dependent protease